MLFTSNLVLSLQNFIARRRARLVVEKVGTIERCQKEDQGVIPIW